MNAADAVVNFAAWLSTRNEPTGFGRYKDSSVAAERVSEFLEANNLGDPAGDSWINPDQDGKAVEEVDSEFKKPNDKASTRKAKSKS